MHGTVAQVIKLVIEIRDTERLLEHLETQLDCIKNIPTPPEGSSISHVLAHALVTNILPHLPSKVLGDPVAMASLLRKFAIEETMAIEWRAPEDEMETDVG